MYGSINVWIEVWAEGSTDGWMEVWVDGWMDVSQEYMGNSKEMEEGMVVQRYGCKDGGLDGWTEVCKEGWMTIKGVSECSR